MKIKELMEVKISKVTTNKVLEKIKSFLLSKNQYHIVTLNPEMIIEAQKNSYFKKIINSANLVFADGVGILWALDFLNSSNKFSFQKRKNIFYIFFQKLFSFMFIIFSFLFTFLKLMFSQDYRKHILRYRTHGVDLIYKICESDLIENKRLFLLGAGEGIANKTAQTLREKYSNINIVGAEEGIEKNNESEEINQKLIKKINDTKPNILLVAFGAPKQEIWISENLQKIPSVKLAIGIGGSFDFISGKIKRAPLFLQKMGLEWLWRLLLEPKRIKRIYKAIVKFPMLILKYRINN